MSICAAGYSMVFSKIKILLANLEKDKVIYLKWVFGGIELHWG
jgi:hypothetical protein